MIILKRIFLLSLIFIPIISFGQTVNRTGDINFKNRATFGTQTDIYTPTDTTVWLQIGENNTTKGILMPRLADTLDYVGHPTAGTLIYQNSDNKIYYYNGTSWASTSSSKVPDLHDVLAAGDTATNDIYLGGTSSLIFGTTNSSDIFGGQLQYIGNQFTIGTVDNNNRILIDGATIAIGTDVSNEYVGIGTLSPAYKLDVLGNTRFQNNVLIDGGLQMPIRTVTTSTTITTSDYTVRNASGTNTFTMPAASTCTGKIFHLVCNTGTVTLTVDYLNYANTNITTIAAGSGVTIQSDGTAYIQIGQ